MPAALCPRRHLALGLEAAAALGLLATAAAAAPHFDCRPGAVAFETVHLPGRNVVLLRQGPGCPVLAPEPPTTSGSPQASEDAAEAALVDDAAEDAVLSPASALHAGSARAHTAGLRRAPVLTSGAAIAGVLATMVLLAAISRAVWDRNVRQPRLLAQKAAADEAERARLASEEAERRAREEELEQAARAEAERRAREVALKGAREEATTLAQRALQEQEEAVEASPTGRSSRPSRSPRDRCQYDDNRHAFQLARQEEEERRSQQEKDDVHRKGQGAAEAPPEKKGWCAPCGCSSGKAAAEPGRR